MVGKKSTTYLLEGSNGLTSCLDGRRYLEKKFGGLVSLVGLLAMFFFGYDLWRI
jgi:hypothetical protein